MFHFAVLYQINTDIFSVFIDIIFYSNPNITGAMQAGGLSGFQNIIRMSGTGAFNDEVSKSFFEKISNGSWATSSGKVTLDASSSNDIFGRATTAQPPACQILMIIKV